MEGIVEANIELLHWPKLDEATIQSRIRDRLVNIDKTAVINKSCQLTINISHEVT
jgi:hypothetical protein